MALRAVPDHPKFADLKQRIGRCKGATLGYLEAMWHFCGRFTPQGNIGKYTDAAIEAWIEWDGEPGSLIEALCDSGWIDRDETHRLVVHDWHEHADKATKLTLKRKKLDFVRTPYGHCGDTVHTPGGLPVPEPVPEPVPASSLTPTHTTPVDAENDSGHSAVVSPKTVSELPESVSERVQSIATWLHQYMGGEWGYPDDAIVIEIHEAIRGAPIEDLRLFLQSLHKRHQRPKKSWKFFVEVIDAEFAARNRRGEIERPVRAPEAVQ